MFLPIRLTWNLQMAKAAKVGVFVLFGSGFICIAFATLRVVQLGVDGRGKTTTPEPKWMLLWTVLECTIGKRTLTRLPMTCNIMATNNFTAIMIGCAPTFAVFIRKQLNSSKKPSYDAHGYLKQPTNEEIKMKSVCSAKPKRDNMEAYWNDVHSSQEELAKSAGHIVVRTTMHSHDERVDAIARA
jgi:hypothetical protein